MNINIKTTRNFTIAYNKMREKYGEEFEKLNGLHDSDLNYGDFIDAFIDAGNVADGSIDGNANARQKDICSLECEMNKPIKKLLSFNKIFYEINKKYGLETAREWFENEWNGSFYLHNATDGSFKPYCYAYSLERLVNEGQFFVKDGFNNVPPKHLGVFCDFVGEFVSWTANRTTGAVGLPDFLIYSYWFWKRDLANGYYLVDPTYYRDQEFQRIIYKLNQNYLRINQSAFTNFSIFDRPYLIEVFGGKEFPDGEPIMDHIEELIEYQKAFMRVVAKVRSENLFTFPVLSYSLLYQDGKFVDEEFARWCSDHNCKWNDSNFFVSGDITSLSSCCRLISDVTKANKASGFINSIGGTSLKVGSAVVNTINLMRIALEADESEEEYLRILGQRVHLCIRALDSVRHILRRNVEKGVLNNYDEGLIDFNTQYNTIGINAMYEAIRQFGYIETDELGYEKYTEDGVRFASQIMDVINDIKESYDFDYSINVEAVPGERAAVILCEKDALLYDTQEYGDVIYSNQWIPLAARCSIDEKMKLGAILDIKCGGGQISHIGLENNFPNTDVAWNMLNKIAASGVIYFAFNTKISVCKYNHGFIGDTCPTCGNPVADTYQRVVGFLTPRKSYSKARRNEFEKRQWYELSELY